MAIKSDRSDKTEIKKYHENYRDITIDRLCNIGVKLALKSWPLGPESCAIIRQDGI